jgi:tetratricopeptide (TPR) repeat protein
MNRGNYDEANKGFKKVFDIYLKNYLGEKNIFYAAFLTNFSSNLLKLGYYEEAKIGYLDAIEIIKK